VKMDNPQQSHQRKPTKQYNDYLKYSGLAFQMMATAGIATWIGYKIDQYLELRFPAFTISLLLVSLIGVIYWLIKSVTNNSEK